MISDADQDYLGEAIFDAIKDDDIDWVTDLIEEGVYLNTVDDLGWTPLMRAGMSNHMST